MEPLKVIITGPVGAGKSTLIRTLSETEVVDTDAIATEAIGKATTTVALDHGTMHLDGQLLHLFGTPGQDRFDFMWEILAKGALGILLMVRADRPDTIPAARNILDFVVSRTPVPHVVGVTHLDKPKVWQPEEIALFLGTPLERVVGFDPRQPEDAARPLARLLELIGTQST